MASQRITRDTFDAVVQEKMKRYRISMEQAIANTIREFQLEAGSSKMDSYDSHSRDQERLSYRDLPRDHLSRKWDIEMRRDSGSNPLYFRELGRESSGGLHSDPVMDRWGSVDPLLKERLYREELLARDLDLSRRSWELERNTLSGPELSMTRSDMFREFRASQSLELGPGKEVFREPGPGQSPRGVMHMLAAKGQGGQRLGSGGHAGKAGESSGIKQSPQKKDMPVGENEFSEQIVMWAKFNKVKGDSDLLRQHKALFKVETETCRMVVNSFKGRISVHHTELCFSSLKPISHPTLNSPKIDNDLLDLLVATKTVTVKNDFFDAIKPFDKEMMILQQRLLKCATPLLLACNTFELKQPILTDPKQLLSALDNTMFMARKSLVLLGQTFALATALRQNNVMEVLGISGTELKPSKYPNFKDSFLFGREFILKLKDWLKKSGHKLTLKSRANVPAVDKEETKTEAESEEKTSADPNVVATIDQLLEYTKKGDKGEGEKPAFWFLFDKSSNEYKYYQQKLEQFHKSTGHLDAKTAQTTKAKKSPEELAVESVRAMLYARKALLVKRKLFGSLTLSRRSKGKKPVHRLSKPMKASRKIRKVSQKVGKNNLTQDHKKENVNQEVKEDGKTPAVGKGTVTLAVKMEAATVAVEEAASTAVAEEAASTAVAKEAASAAAAVKEAEAASAAAAVKEAEAASAAAAVKEAAASAAAAVKEAAASAAAAVKEVASAAAAVKEVASAAAAVKEVASAVKEAASAAAAVKEEVAASAVKEAAATAVVKEAAAVKKEAAVAVAAVKKEAAVKKAATTPAVKKAATTPAVKKAATTPAVKKAATTPAVKKAVTTPAVKKAATTPAVKEAATPVGKKGNVASEVKKQTSVKPAQDASTKQSSKKVDVKKQEVPCKSSTGATSKLLKKDQPPDVKAETPKEPQVSDVDEKTKDTAIKLAQFVVQMGPEIEEFSMQNSVNNPDFWFLREKDSPAYKYYKSKLTEFKEEQQEATSDVDDGELEGVKTGDEGEASGADGASVAAFSQMPTPSRPPILRKRVAKLKVGMLPAKRVCLVDEPQVHDPVRIDYERPKGRGYNRRKKPADLEFANKKLTQQNVGFQMLSKMGWQEGQGLGSSGSGIKNPIKVGAVSAGEGLGGESKEPPQSTDDNFDAFRQRMMNMYKQKISK